jgi:hypothetical protein
MSKRSVIFVLAICLLAGLCLPTAGAADPSAQETGPVVTVQELNVTNASLANATIPDQYLVTPTPLEIGVSTSDTNLGGPKGEMSAVPRTIGFSITPELIAVIVIVILVLGAGAWYLLKQKRETKKEE